MNPPSDENYQAGWHRDLPYQHFVSSRPLAISALVCLDPFTTQTGGTCVLPFSHRTEAFPSEAYVQAHQIGMLASPETSLMFDSMLFHRAGANRSGRPRRGLNHVYSLPFLKQQISLPRALRAVTVMIHSCVASSDMSVNRPIARLNGETAGCPSCRRDHRMATGLWDASRTVRSKQRGGMGRIRPCQPEWYVPSRAAVHGLSRRPVCRSLAIVRDPEGEFVAVLPAHSEGTALVSHGGLSYGGFVIGAGMKTPLMLRVFESVLLALREQGFTALTYKTIPHIYHRQPAEEDRYALFLLGAELIRRDVLSVVLAGVPVAVPAAARTAQSSGPKVPA